MQQKLTVIRVKRKRNADAPDDLVVEALGGAAKRAHTTLATQLGSMALGSGDAGAPPEQKPAAEAAGGSVRASGLQRFSRLTTLSAAQVSSLDEEQLRQFLHSRQQQRGTGGQRQASPGPGSRPANGSSGSLAGPSPAVPPAPVPCYEQVRQRRRGLTLFQATEAVPDPLAGFAKVYEVVQREGDGTGSHGAGWQQGQQDGGSGSAAGWQQYAEGTLMCNELPVVREPAPPSMPAAGPPASPAGGAGVPGAAGCMETSGNNEPGSEDEYVYDLYAAAAPPEDGSGGKAADRWMEMHASGRAPVIQILDDDTWLVMEASDVEDSDADTEDSNAEGYYAHDYPDEASYYSSGSSEGHDPEGDTFHSRRKERGWWEDSDGGVSEDSENGGPWGGVPLGRRPQW